MEQKIKNMDHVRYNCINIDKDIAKDKPKSMCTFTITGNFSKTNITSFSHMILKPNIKLIEDVDLSICYL
jgi:hypothetical protein